MTGREYQEWIGRINMSPGWHVPPRPFVRFYSGAAENAKFQTIVKPHHVTKAERWRRLRADAVDAVGIKMEGETFTVLAHGGPPDG